MSQALRIGLTSPFAHPYVRRGVERLVAELAEWLGERGHTVTLVTTTADRGRTARWPGDVTVVYRHAGRPRGRGRLRIDETLATLPAIAGGVRRLDVDVIQSHHAADSAGVALARPGRTRPPLVLWLPGVPRRAAMGGRPLNRAAAAVAFRRADRIHALSRHAATALREEFGRDCEVLPPGVRTERYAGEKPVTESPVLLCAAAADDPRKQVELLVRAFPEVLRHRPDARLVLAPPRPEVAALLLRQLPDAARARTELRSVPDSAALAALYREATVSVLPSLDEAFGLVVVESLAAGTPVVGSDHGAIPETLDDDAVGRRFAPGDATGLARALVETIDLAADPNTAARCRAHAGRWDWSVLGPRHEEAYRGALC